MSRDLVSEFKEVCREDGREDSDSSNACVRVREARLRDRMAALEENLEILHDAMRMGGLTHTQGAGYAESRRCQIVTELLRGTEGGLLPACPKCGARVESIGNPCPARCESSQCTSEEK